MNNRLWHITIEIARQKEGGSQYFQKFLLEVNPEEYVLDGIERIWAKHDRSLTFRHACHHSTCGACGMLVNGVEKLTCITPIQSVTHDGGTLRIEPLRNFPVLSDLVVDMSTLYQRIEQTHCAQTAELQNTYLPYEKSSMENHEEGKERLIDCIECGLCISACPAASTSFSYLGPAVLAAAQQAYVQEKNCSSLDLVNNQNGLWRCHSAYECTEVCPSNVDPAFRIMNFRRRVIGHQVKKWLSKKEV